ncbi:hypothetical protein [Streptomyces sp. NPDC004726]
MEDAVSVPRRQAGAPPRIGGLLSGPCPRPEFRDRRWQGIATRDNKSPETYLVGLQLRDATI